MPCNFIKKESVAQVFSCEFCEISKNTTFFYRTPQVDASIFLSSGPVALNFVTAITCFSPFLKLKIISSLITCFSLFCGIFVFWVKWYKRTAIENSLSPPFIHIVKFCDCIIIGWLLCTNQNDLTSECKAFWNYKFLFVDT